MDEVEETVRLIEKLRIHLHEKARGRSFTDPEVIKVSQELNQILNKYERLLSEKRIRESY